jgi:hypothetical protein
LLRYISHEIDGEFVGIAERWREVVKVVFRKHPEIALITETPRQEKRQSADCELPSDCCSRDKAAKQSSPRPSRGWQVEGVPAPEGRKTGKKQTIE